MKLDMSVTKESLISTLDKQLSLLISSYENQIKKLKEENAILRGEISSLKSLFDNRYSDDRPNDSKKTDFIIAKKTNNTSSLNSPHQNSFPSSIRNSLIQLKRITSLVECSDILAEIIASDPQEFNMPELQMITAFIEKTLKFKNDNPVIKKYTYTLMFSIIRQFHFSKEFRGLVNANSDKLNEIVIEIKDYHLVTELAKIYFIYKNHQNLSKLIIHVSEKVTFDDDKIDKSDIITILWFSFFLDLNSRVINNSNIFVKLLNQEYSHPAIIAYKTFYKVIEGKMEYEDGRKKIYQSIGDITFFTLEEKSRLLNSINKRLRKHHKNNPCNREQVKVNEQINREIKYIPHESYFEWPSTDAKNLIYKNDYNLTDIVEIRLLGYQNKGLKKQERWEILEKAVIEMGLKKVAYTLAQNIQLTKLKKNGEIKFQNALREWEYDLYKLKKKYYNPFLT